MTFHQTNCSLSFPVIWDGPPPLSAHLLLLLSSEEDLSGGGWGLSQPPGDLSKTWTNYFEAERMFRVTSDLLRSTLQQGRPLREQQEVAAAVIQRCYKKYKQVSFGYGFSRCRWMIWDEMRQLNGSLGECVHGFCFFCLQAYMDSLEGKPGWVSGRVPLNRWWSLTCVFLLSLTVCTL